METRSLGSLSVSVVGLGCNNFGLRLDQAGTDEVVAAALDTGINFFDTADVYGKTRSEELLGRALGAQRHRVVVATKFGIKLDEQRLGGASPAYIRRAVEDSLRRLGTDYIDLYQLHRPDPSVPLEDTLGALDELVKVGKVREIGSSNFSAEQIREGEAKRKPADARFVSVQNEYSLLERTIEGETLTEIGARGLGLLPYFPLASGLLSGKYDKGRPLPTGSRLANPLFQFGDRFANERNFGIVEALTDFARARGRSLLELALSWLRAKPEVASIIAGATSPTQVVANVASSNWKLTPAELTAIDALAPRQTARAA
jgi:aryl-alcohol dehydrogenase-like predicted oxidoreductase